MGTSAKPSSRFWTRASLNAFRAIKGLYHMSRGRNSSKTILFIIGCQRSGTTLMQRIFEWDLATKVYGERSKLTSNDPHRRIRLNSLNLVREEIDRARAPLIILRPLVETQNSLKMLNYFPNSKGLWMYRHYKDVASSNLMKFGIKNGINNLRPIVENNVQDWRSENVSENVRSIVLKYFSEDMNPYDAAALFWFARNSFFFELKLDQNSDVLMCRYDDLATNPLETAVRIYNFIGHTFPGERLLKEVHPRSVKKGKHIELCPDIEHLCSELFAKLNEAHATSVHFN